MDVQRYQNSLNEWVKSFPEGRQWVPMLLIGFVEHEMNIVSSCRDAKQRIGSLLWQWRNEKIDDNWLCGSNVCSSLNERPIDILKKTHKSLKRDGAAGWGVTAEQHADLLAWCNRVINERKVLKGIAR